MAKETTATHPPGTKFWRDGALYQVTGDGQEVAIDLAELAKHQPGPVKQEPPKRSLHQRHEGEQFFDDQGQLHQVPDSRHESRPVGERFWQDSIAYEVVADPLDGKRSLKEIARNQPAVGPQAVADVEPPAA